MPGFELAEWLPFGSLSISGVSVSSLGPSDLALMTTFLETFAPNAHPHRHPCRRVDRLPRGVVWLDTLHGSQPLWLDNTLCVSLRVAKSARCALWVTRRGTRPRGMVFL